MQFTAILAFAAIAVSAAPVCNGPNCSPDGGRPGSPCKAKSDCYETIDCWHYSFADQPKAGVLGICRPIAAYGEYCAGDASSDVLSASLPSVPSSVQISGPICHTGFKCTPVAGNSYGGAIYGNCL
ncbi:hypothetical protein BDR26DRAFT_899802 [Obelidium mucronatum]|nr:hypothetical protein BDR26DRAFT_938863 [Obelidium mucronatum]KAI9330410.1 hypothetical protein BDR26DRAFT_899802 [Obelidium mucronatum]